MMKTVINLGKVNDSTRKYYLSTMKSNYVYLPNDILFTESPGQYFVDRILIVNSDSGVYPGTVQQLDAVRQEQIIEALLENNIIEKYQDYAGDDGYTCGPNYNADIPIIEY